jgi:peptidoglycan hydrolase-like protein with peptidoglycan-binding domain
VLRQTLASSVAVDGELGHGEVIPIMSRAAGTVTWLPEVGAVVRRGGVLLRVDDHPVVLLLGKLPMYRALSTGVEGPDVAQFEKNLHALGYDSFTVDDEFTSATAAAVRNWQEKLGLPETGRVEQDRVVVSAGAVRIAERMVRIGGAGAGEVLRGTGTRKVVTVDVKAGEAGWARSGVKVTVTLPGGRSSGGTVTAVGTSATGKGDKKDEATLPVTVTLADEKVAKDLDTAPVEVSYTGERRKNVLTVPVAALLALAEGGYGLEIVEAGTSRYMPVQVGMFADGRVEVKGDGLADGLTVGVPT